jgi:hypothetical protein
MKSTPLIYPSQQLPAVVTGDQDAVGAVPVRRTAAAPSVSMASSSSDQCPHCDCWRSPPRQPRLPPTPPPATPPSSPPPTSREASSDNSECCPFCDCGPHNGVRRPPSSTRRPRGPPEGAEHCVSDPVIRRRDSMRTGDVRCHPLEAHSLTRNKLTVNDRYLDCLFMSMLNGFPFLRTDHAAEMS